MSRPKERVGREYTGRRGLGTRSQRRYGRAEAEADLFDYIEPFYNRRRRHSTLGYVSPQDFLANWIKRQHEQELAA